MLYTHKRLKMIRREGEIRESIVVDLSQRRLLVDVGQPLEGHLAGHGGRSVNAGNVIAIAHFRSVVGGVVNLTGAVHLLLDTGSRFRVVDVHRTGPSARSGRQERRYIRISIEFSVCCRMARIHGEQVAIGHVHLKIIRRNKKKKCLENTESSISINENPGRLALFSFHQLFVDCLTNLFPYS